MKQALISPDETVNYISAWTEDKPKQPIYTVIESAERVAEVCENEFEVAPPLFWQTCADNVVADQWYFNSVSQEFIPVPPPAPQNAETIQGSQTL
jgi:hypothetical protein